MTEETHEHLQDAVDAAHFFLMLDKGQQHGMLREGSKFEVDRARCEEVLRHGANVSIFPTILRCELASIFDIKFNRIIQPEGRRKPQSRAPLPA